MSLFTKKTEYPRLPVGDYEIVLRCSICNGEQVVCLKDRRTDEMRDLMLVRDSEDLQGFCDANKIKMDSIRKVY